ncbi:MAG TPA: ABC transporter substrate-binding protein [Candidatus Angelobacter sp.]
MQLTSSGHRGVGASGQPAPSRAGAPGHRKTKTALAIALLVIAASTIFASTRPHYGSTARVLIQHKINSLDPLVETDYPGDRDKLSPLVFETLTELDAQGHVHPRLANSWQSEAAQRVWQFQLRLANFQDGTAVTSTIVVASLKSVSPEWKFTVYSRQTFTIETPTPSPHLAELLSLPKFAVIKRLPNATLVGSGPYKLSQWQPGEHALFTANDDYWEGRPYPDAIEVQMGASMREHLLERNLGHDHAALLGLDQVRALEQTSQNVVLSRPAELLVILFLQPDQAARNGKKAVDPHIREAIADSINRSAISNVLLQKKAASTTALLPQWLTGYAFLFPDKPDPEQAHKLRTQAGAVLPVSLAYDFSDPVSRMVAERIAVDAHETGIAVQPVGDAHINTRTGRKASTADAVLLRLPLRALDASTALAAVADDLDLSPEMLAAITSAGRADELFAAERKTLEDFRVVPVAHLSQALWLNNTVHNWQQLPNGDWNLDQLWVEGAR